MALALFLRDLALPYCLLAWPWPSASGGRGEPMVYIAGLVGWAVFYGLHCWEAMHWIALGPWPIAKVGCALAA